MAQNAFARRGKAQMNYLSLDTGDTTINVSNVITLSADLAQVEVLALAGTAGAGFTVQFPWTPKDAGMQLIVKNTSGQTATIKAITADNGATPTTGVTVATAGIKYLVYNGTDWVVYTWT